MIKQGNRSKDQILAELEHLNTGDDHPKFSMNEWERIIESLRRDVNSNYVGRNVRLFNIESRLNQIVHDAQMALDDAGKIP